jgi:tRNA A-37 threonylcarbamoyl transferase component Bud32
LKEKITNLLDEYEGTQLLPQTLLDKIKHITNRISKNYNGKATIVHGDLSPANILIKDNSFFIVDWDLSKIDCNYIDMFWPLYWAKREFNVSNSKLDKITESLLTGYNIKVSSIEDTLKNREFYFLKFCLDQILYYRYVTLEHRKVENITRILMELIDLLDP